MGHWWSRAVPGAVALVLMSAQPSHAIGSLLQEFTFSAQVDQILSCNDETTCLSHSTKATAETFQESLNHFTIRFGLNVNADGKPFNAAPLETGIASYTTKFKIGPGNYDLTITAHRVGALRRTSDDFLCNGSLSLGDMSAPAFTINGVADERLSDFVFPGASIANGLGDDDATVPSDAQSQVIIFRGRLIPDEFSLTFAMVAVMNSGLCAVSARLGAPNLSTQDCDACNYPGVPARNIKDDGLFVEVNIDDKCGDGVTQTPEQCDQGNLNGDPSSCCNFDCTFKEEGRVCRSAAGPCDQVERCSGDKGSCPVDVNVPADTACLDDGDPCTTDKCDNLGQCIHTAVPPPCAALCGNGVKDQGEDCDLGKVDNGSPSNCCDVSCKFRLDNAPCEDGLFCNGAEHCSNGVCGGAAGNPCSGLGACAICDEANNVCDTSQCPNLCGNGHLDAGEECDLGTGVNGLATNCCGANCRFRPDNSSCTDQLFCDGAEHCSGGACVGSAGNPCRRDCETCNEADKICDTSGCTPRLPAQPTRALLIAEIFDGDGDRYDTSAGGSVRGTLDLDANGDLFFTAADLARLPRCASDAVLVGGVCIDKYEASVFANPPGSADRGAHFGVNERDYPCRADGSDCPHKLFALSVPDVAPSVSITWFQAQQACASVGKRLLTNAEWQMVAAGTPDPGNDDDNLTSCNTNSEFVPVAAGSRSACVSKWGIYDMVGNAWEWVAEWVPASTDCPGWGTFSDDSMCLAGASTTATGPGALIRGGGAGFTTAAGPLAIRADFSPSAAGLAIGFRCARAPF